MGALPLLQALSTVTISPLTFAVIFLALMGIILAYLFSRAISSPQMEAMVREEFSHLIFSIFIIFMWFIIYVMISGITSVLICNGSQCDQNDVALYSLEVLKSKLFAAYFSLILYESWIGFLSTVGLSIPLPLANAILMYSWIGLSPLGGLSVLSNALITLIESVGYLIGLTFGRLYLVQFFSVVVPNVLLPLGIAMRALPFTRRTGSSIIAMSFALYFIFPLSVTLSHSLIFGSQQFDFQYDGASLANTPTFASICDNETYAFESTEEASGLLAAGGTVSYTNPWWKAKGWITEAPDKIKSFVGKDDGLLDYLKSRFSLSSPLSIFVSTVGTFLSPTSFAHAAFYWTISQIQQIAEFAALIMVTFVLEIIISVTGYRAIAWTIGGEMEILGLTKVV